MSGQAQKDERCPSKCRQVNADATDRKCAPKAQNQRDAKTLDDGKTRNATSKKDSKHDAKNSRSRDEATSSEEKKEPPQNQTKSASQTPASPGKRSEEDDDNYQVTSIKEPSIAFRTACAKNASRPPIVARASQLTLSRSLTASEEPGSARLSNLSTIEDSMVTANAVSLSSLQQLDLTEVQVSHILPKEGPRKVAMPPTTIAGATKLQGCGPSNNGDVVKKDAPKDSKVENVRSSKQVSPSKKEDAVRRGDPPAKGTLSVSDKKRSRGVCSTFEKSAVGNEQPNCSAKLRGASNFTAKQSHGRKKHSSDESETGKRDSAKHSSHKENSATTNSARRHQDKKDHAEKTAGEKSVAMDGVSKAEKITERKDSTEESSSGEHGSNALPATERRSSTKTRHLETGPSSEITPTRKAAKKSSTSRGSEKQNSSKKRQMQNSARRRAGGSMNSDREPPSQSENYSHPRKKGEELLARTGYTGNLSRNTFGKKDLLKEASSKKHKSTERSDKGGSKSDGSAKKKAHKESIARKLVASKSSAKKDPATESFAKKHPAKEGTDRKHPATDSPDKKQTAKESSDRRDSPKENNPEIDFLKEKIAKARLAREAFGKTDSTEQKFFGKSRVESSSTADGKFKPARTLQELKYQKEFGESKSGLAKSDPQTGKLSLSDKSKVGEFEKSKGRKGDRETKGTSRSGTLKPCMDELTLPIEDTDSTPTFTDTQVSSLAQFGEPGGHVRIFERIMKALSATSGIGSSSYRRPSHHVEDSSSRPAGPLDLLRTGSLDLDAAERPCQSLGRTGRTKASPRQELISGKRILRKSSRWKGPPKPNLTRDRGKKIRLRTKAEAVRMISRSPSPKLQSEPPRENRRRLLRMMRESQIAYEASQTTTSEERRKEVQRRASEYMKSIATTPTPPKASDNVDPTAPKEPDPAKKPD